MKQVQLNITLLNTITNPNLTIVYQCRSQEGGGGGGWGSAKIPGRLRRKNVAGGLRHQAPAGAPTPDPLLNGVWDGAPTGSGAERQRGQGAEPQQHSCGEVAPGFGAEPHPPRPPGPHFWLRH